MLGPTKKEGSESSTLLKPAPAALQSAKHLYWTIAEAIGWYYGSSHSKMQPSAGDSPNISPDEARRIKNVWTEIHGFAPVRFDRYVLEGDEDELDGLARYLWNITLCGALTPALNGAEIMLKNSIHRVMQWKGGGEHWFDREGLLTNNQTLAVEKAYRELTERFKERTREGESKREITADDIVAELGFSFWTSLLNPKSDSKREIVWNRLLNYRGLPHLPTNMRDRDKVQAAFNAARSLRNRAYHHEPIVLDLKTLETTYVRTVEAIGWISPVYARTLKCVDTFPTVFNAGIAPYRTTLLKALG